MVFSTPVFMFSFLVLTLVVYYAMPLKWRNAVLLGSSLFFYYWGEQKYTIIMILSTLIDFLHGHGNAEGDGIQDRRHGIER